MKVVHPSAPRLLAHASHALWLIIASAALLTGCAAPPASETGRLPLAPSATPNDAEIEIELLRPGQLVRFRWGKYEVGVLRRTDKDIEALEATPTDELAAPAGQLWRQSFGAAADMNDALPSLLMLDQVALEDEPLRSQRRDVFVVILDGPEYGCALRYVHAAHPEAPGNNWRGGFEDPCSGAQYDLAGRKLAGSPGNAWNLFIPPHRFAADGRLVIGVGEGRTALRYDFESSFAYHELPPVAQLQQAAFRGRVDLVRRVIDGSGGNPDIRFSWAADTTPLIAAASNGRHEVVRYLLDKGADPNLASADGMTPLHAAIGAGEVASIRLLLTAGADVNQPLAVGRCEGTPLMLALCFYEIEISGSEPVEEIVALLLDNGADPHRVHAGSNAYIKAALMKEPRLIDALAR